MKNRTSERIGGFFKQHGYKTLPMGNLISNSFPDTFSPSAFHDIIQSLADVDQNSKKLGKKWGVDWTFRHVDQEKVGFSAFHLSAFQMIVGLETENDEGRYKRVTSACFQLLYDLGLDPQRCVVSYFDGAQLRGFSIPRVSSFVDALKDSGIPSRSLLPIPGVSNLTNFNRQGELVGPRMEVYYPIHNSGLIEIATIVFESYRLKSRTTFLPIKNRVSGFAIGLERLLAAVADCPSVFDIFPLSEYSKRIRQDIPFLLAEVEKHHERKLIDSIRSLTIVQACTPRPYNVARLRRVRRLLKVTAESSHRLGLFRYESMVADLVDLVLKEDLPSVTLSVKSSASIKDQLMQAIDSYHS